MGESHLERETLEDASKAGRKGMFSLCMISPPLSPPLSSLPTHNFVLDGLRAVAVMGVLVHHFGLHLPSFLEYGPLSVRFFFALSGYFLMKWAGRPTSVSLGSRLREYHARRAARIIPPLYLSLAFLFILSSLGGWGGGGLLEMGWHAAFLTNFYVVREGVWPPVFSHLWSLSVQEQFYVVASFLVLVVPRPYFLRLLVGGLLLGVGFRVFALQAQWSDYVRWLMLPGVMDSFCVGGLAAWVESESESKSKSGTKGLRTFLLKMREKWELFGFVALFCFLMGRWLRVIEAGTSCVGDAGSFWRDMLTASIEVWEGIFLFWVIMGSVWGWQRGALWVQRVLSHPYMVYVGRVSFGIYIYHIVVFMTFVPILDAVGLTESNANFLRVFILVGITLGLASLSWRYLEGPLLGSNTHTPHTPHNTKRKALF